MPWCESYKRGEIELFFQKVFLSFTKPRLKTEQWIVFFMLTVVRFSIEQSWDCETLEE